MNDGVPNEQPLKVPASVAPTADARTDDFAYDGMWPFTGFGGMMVRLAEEFVESRQELAEANRSREKADENEQQQQQQQQQQQTGEDDNFVVLTGIDLSDETSIHRLQENLDERGLRMADGVLRRIVEGCCPPKLQITRLDEDTTMQRMRSLKKEGNQHFVEKGYREAIDCYDFALESIPIDRRDRLCVAPGDQLDEIVAILSNKAECLLRKFRYEEASEVSTEALIFDNGHQKSRLRRARANLEIGMYDRYEATSRGDGTMTGVAYLVQARNDLDEILENPESTPAGRRAARDVVSKVDKLLAGAKKKVLSKDPDAEWDMTVLKMQSRCW